MVAEATVKVVGMDCSHCAQRLGEALERSEGVIRARVDPAGAATVRYDEARVSEAQLADHVRAAGFEPV